MVEKWWSRKNAQGKTMQPVERVCLSELIIHESVVLTQCEMMIGERHSALPSFCMASSLQLFVLVSRAPSRSLLSWLSCHWHQCTRLYVHVCGFLYVPTHTLVADCLCGVVLFVGRRHNKIGTLCFSHTRFVTWAFALVGSGKLCHLLLWIKQR